MNPTNPAGHDLAEFEEALFAAAQALPHARSVAFLHRACEDAAMRQRIETLLRVDDEPGGALDTPPIAQLPDLARALTQQARPEEQRGDVVGRYKLLEEIGEGGFGVVWKAEQREPIRRHVALKIIKSGMDTRDVIARFEAERQALALMDHPNIAHAFDAGATDTGRPFFVMEWIRGTPITNFCDENKLTPGIAWNYSSRYATPFSTPTRSRLSIAISSHRTFW